MIAHNRSERGLSSPQQWPNFQSGADTIGCGGRFGVAADWKVRAPAIHRILPPLVFAFAIFFLHLREAFPSDAPPLPPLTSVSGSPRLPGKFVWADLVTDDVASARKFYAGLFGWTFKAYGEYVIASNDERPLCGIFARPRPKDRSAEPRWFGYISVANVDRARRDALKAGGRVLVAPQQLPKRGEQAVFADSEGALFGVIRSSAGDPQDFLAEPGDWIWIQLLSGDANRASEFYQAVGGYEVIPNTTSNRLSDFVLASEGYARATIR